jgi:hypothetical protein
MRILTEVVGGVVLLLVFAYGVREIVNFIGTWEKKNGVPAENDRTRDAGPAATDERD